MSENQEEYEVEQTGFESWAIVEVFGHKTFAGKVTEFMLAGKQFIQVDVPETNDFQAFTKLLHPDAIYGITPVTKQAAIVAANNICAKPVELRVLQLQIERPALQQLTLGDGFGDDDPFIEDEDDDIGF